MCIWFWFRESISASASVCFANSSCVFDDEDFVLVFSVLNWFSRCWFCSNLANNCWLRHWLDFYFCWSHLCIYARFVSLFHLSIDSSFPISCCHLCRLWKLLFLEFLDIPTLMDLESNSLDFIHVFECEF